MEGAIEYSRLKGINIKEYLGKRVFIRFLARDVELKTQKDKSSRYLAFNMCDGAKIVEARLFYASEKHIKMVKDGAVCNAAIDVKPYEKSPNGISCVIYNIEVIEEDSREYLNWSAIRDEAMKAIEKYMGELADTLYYPIVYNIMTEKWGKFFIWCGGKSVHHTELSGLMAHTYEVATMALAIADSINEVYKKTVVDKGLLLSAALLHDVCKTNELCIDTVSGKTEYSYDSALINHTVGAVVEIGKVASRLGLGVKTEGKSEEQTLLEDEAVKTLIHCVAAHHGTPEMGSAMAPSLPEAMILHAADRLSAEVYMYESKLEGMESRESAVNWVAGKMIPMYKRIGS